MNVALEPASTTAPAPGRQPGLEPAGCHSEWTDPEGDDWFSSVYRELTQESTPTTVDRPGSEVVYWFG